MLNGDNFTHTYRFDLSQSNAYAQSLGCPVLGYGTRSTTAPAPFAAEDITILTDGYCASSCAVFSEMMKTDGGVKFVVSGGEPSYGPMQAVSGTQGSSVLSFGLIGNYQDEIRKYSDAASSIGLTPSNISALFAASNSSLHVQGSTGNPTAGNITSTDAPGNATGTSATPSTTSAAGFTATLPASASPSPTGAAGHLLVAGGFSLLALELVAVLLV
ncbi:hypothetical protein MMC11_001594 [Xylographa trunciseda]|nr:hypothetical protein [Xylographa trunciseda]